MKKSLIILAGLALLIAGALVWLSFSVGPETAPQDMRSIDVQIDAS